jgi:hypothetical protein
MIRVWEKINNEQYQLIGDEVAVGILQIDFKTMNAVFKTFENEFYFTRKGVWKSKLDISDKNGAIIAKNYFEKWYDHQSILEYNGKKYKFAVRNNPMAEYAILDDEKLILAYGLHPENSKIKVKITRQDAYLDYVLDALIWLSFATVAEENNSSSKLEFVNNSI